MCKLNKVMNSQMIFDIVRAIDEETIIDFYTESTDYDVYFEILNKIDNFIFDNLSKYEKQVNEFNDYKETDDNDHSKYESFEFECVDICFYLNKDDFTERLLDRYTFIVQSN